MHDVVPEGEKGAYHVPFFNPGSNHRRSLLRVINPAYEDGSRGLQSNCVKDLFLRGQFAETNGVFSGFCKSAS